MPSSTTVRDVLYRVSAQLHDVSPQFTRWTQRELVSWLNDGQKAIAKYMPSSCSRVDTIRLAAGTKQDISLILPGQLAPQVSGQPSIYGGYLQSVIRNMGATGLTPGRAIRLVDREVMDVNNPTWHSSTGTEVTQYMFDPRMPKTFYVYPGVPTTTNVYVELSYLADPVEVLWYQVDYGMTSNTFTMISIDDKYVDDLVNYILARAYMKDAEFAANAGLASAHAQMFTSSINAQVAALSGVNPNLQSLPMNPNASLPAVRG